MSTNISIINVDDVFKKKNPKLFPYIPKFVLRYIKRIIHQDFINDFLKRNGHKFGLDFVNSAIEEFNIKLEVIGLENIPDKGRFIFASNHPLGGFDGLILLSTVSKKFQNVCFMVNDILMNIKNFEPLFIPINKHGGQGKESAKLIDETYASGIQILYFPAGLVSRKTKGKIGDLEWKKSFINKAVKYERDIIPVFISGSNTNFFYNLANLRKRLKIKWNLEMFFLPNETFKHRNKSLKIIFGKPISFKIFDKSKNPILWAKEVRQMVYSLNEN